MIEYMNTTDRKILRKRIAYLENKIANKDDTTRWILIEELKAIKKLIRIADHNGQWKDEVEVENGQS